MKGKISLILLASLLSSSPLRIHAGGEGKREEKPVEGIIEIASGVEGGSYHSAALSIGKLFRNALPGKEVVVHRSRGSRENMEILSSRSADFAITQNDVAANTFFGERGFDMVPELRGACALFGESLHIMVRREAGIGGLGDLKGKRVCLGPPESGSLQNAVDVLSIFGILDEIRKEDLLFLDFGEYGPFFESKGMDAAFITSGHPSELVEGLLKKGDLALLPLTEEEVEILCRGTRFFFRDTIPAGTYSGQEDDILTVGVESLLVTTSEEPGQVVESILKALFENAGRLGESSLLWRGLSKGEFLKGMTIPLHPASIRFFEELEGGRYRDMVAENRKIPVMEGKRVESRKALPDIDDIMKERRNRPLTLEEVAMMAVERNLDIAAKVLNTRYFREDVSYNKGEFLPVLSMSSTLDNEKTSTYSASISEVLPSGTSLSLGWSGEIAELGYDPDYTSTLSLGIEQELLEGIGVKVGGAEYEKAKFAFLYYIEDLRENIENNLASSIKTYNNLLKAVNSLEIYQNTLNLAEGQLKRAETLYRMGKISEIELIEAQAGVAERREDVVKAKNSVRDHEDNLLEYLHSLFSFTPVPATKLPTMEEIFSWKVPDPETEVKTAMFHRADLQKKRLEIKKYEIDLLVKRNALLPSLTLSTQIGGKSLEPKNTLTQAFSESMAHGEFFFDTGISLSVPIINMKDGANYRKYSFYIERLKTELKKMEEEAEGDVRKYLREIITSIRRVHVTGISRQKGEMKLSREIELFKEGKTTTFKVLSYQEDLTKSRVRELSAIVDFVNALTDYEKAKGTLLQSYGIDFESIRRGLKRGEKGLSLRPSR